MWHSLPITVLGLALLAGVPTPVPADDCAPTDDSVAIVARALRCEAETRANGVDRRTLLEEVLQSHPELPAARWQAGYVREAGDWKPFESVPNASSDTPAIKEYRTLRQAAAESVGDQLKLANWCRKNGLIEQERAHLTAALVFAGDRDLPQVRERLGQRLVNGRWMTRDEIAESERASREMLAAMKVWANRLQNIAERLAGNQRQRDSAIVDLQAIADPAAAPAVELVLSHRNESTALQAVEWFAQIERHQTSLALARQAAFSPWESVRKAAGEALNARRWEEFVPPLLATMRRPAESMFQVLIGGRGEVFYTYFCVQEMVTHWEAARYSIVNFSSLSAQRRQRNPFRGAVIVTRAARRQNDAFRLAQDDFILRERLLGQSNEQAERFNARIGEVLAAATGRAFTSDPNVLWNWWVNQLDVEPRPKRVVIVDEEERVVLPIRDARLLPTSCFVAGVPIWTESGPVAVERIAIGDRVLAKDIETGELAYKPVVLTTRREAPRIVRLTVEGETFDMTGGHPVWVSGSGWTKARDLAAGQPLHTATGTIAVEMVESLGSGTVYNIVVADFHTYFFGEAMILSHDPTIPKLTDVVVPGLPVAE